MRLPDDLQKAIERKVEFLPIKALKAARAAISQEYRKGHNSARGFRDSAQLLSYLITRMPATFGACRRVFQEIQTRLPAFSCRSFLDLGAGPGTASWAALDTFSELSHLFLIEQEPDAIWIGKQLNEHSIFSSWKIADWKNASLTGSFHIPKADMTVLSYSLGELKITERHFLLDKLWSYEIPLTAIIEPGTPKGFEVIRDAREAVLQKGAILVAPCPHASTCPMTGNDWCHFAARIERTRLHRQLKEGTLGYEDEKFSYIVYAHPNKVQSTPSIEGRIVRPPQKGSGFVRLPLCAASGFLKEEVITRSDRERYRKARDAEWGAAWSDLYS